MVATLNTRIRPDSVLFSANIKLLSGLVLMLLAFAFAQAEEAKKPVETIGEVSIIGNTELPTETFNLPWSLPSVEKRSDQSPTNKLPNMLKPIEPVRHKQMVHFLHYYQIEMPHFKAN